MSTDLTYEEVMNTKPLVKLLALFAQALPRAISAGRGSFSAKPQNLTRRYGSWPVAAPDKNSAHPGAIHGGKLNHRAKMAKGGRRVQLPQVRGEYGELRYQTQHERVVAGRRARNPKYLA